LLGEAVRGLVRSTPIFAAIVVLYASVAGAIWQTGEIDLAESPGALVMDPVTRDLFATTGTSTVLRIEEPTQETTSINLPGTAGSLAIDPARRILFAAQPAGGVVSLINIDSGDTSTVTTGGSPGAMAVDPARGLACICDPAGSRIVVIAGTSVARTFITNGTPVAVAVDPLTGHGFASLSSTGLIFEFDVAGTDTSYYAAGSEPAAIEIDPERGEVYVANSAGASITVLDIDSGTTSTVALTQNPVALAVNTETGKLYSAGGSALEIVTTSTQAVLKASLPGQPQAVAVDALSDRAFAVMPAQGLVAEVTSAGDTLLIDVGGAPSACLFNPITNKCYVADPDGPSVDILEAADYDGATVDASGGPGPVVINLKNHEVYVPRYYTARTTIIDGYTDAVSSFRVADGPNGLHIDSATGDVYVVCAWSGAVTVRRAGSSDTLMVPVHAYPHGIDSNSNTGRVYVTNRSSADLSVIDAATLDTALVRTGNYPCFVATNLEDNRIYAANRTTWSLTVVDGATLSTSFAPVGAGPTQIRVNPATNKIFVADSNDRTISEVDGTTLERRVIPSGSTPRALAINRLTNTIYASSGLDGEVIAIDGDTYERTPIRGDIGLFEVHVDPYLNKVYSVSWDLSTLTVIDGVSQTSMILPVGYEPHASAYDPVLEKLYVSNHASNSISIMKLRDRISPRLQVEIDSLAGHISYSSTPTLTGTATSMRTPRNFGIMKVLYKVDGLRGEWDEATITGSGTSVGWQFTLPPLLLGEHTVFVTAIDSTAGSISSSSSSGLLRVSDFEAYTFTRLTPPPGAPQHVNIEKLPEELGMYVTWDHTCGEGGYYELEISSDPAFSEGVLRLSGITEPGYEFGPESFVTENDYLRIVAVDYPHGKHSVTEEGFLLRPSGKAGDRGPAASPLRLLVYPNPSPGEVNVELMGAGSGPAACSIYDVTGQLVAELPVLKLDGGAVARWESNSDAGQRVAPGVYYLRVKTAMGTLTRKIITIK
jgi:YVTN family beta-propeller protein